MSTTAPPPNLLRVSGQHTTPARVWAYVGLGGNVDAPVERLARAVEVLRGQVDALHVSGLWRSAPWGPIEQPDFVNQVVAIRTHLLPEALLDALLSLEAALGRDRARETRWGPRPIDLDLLSWGDAVKNTPRLTLPHPRLAARRFVLAPLCELAPDLVVPGYLKTVRALLDACDDAGRVERLTDSDPDALEGAR